MMRLSFVRTTRNLRVAAVVAIALVPALTACGAEQSDAGDSNAELYSALPSNIQHKGKIVVSSVQEIAPWSYTDSSGTVIGLNADLMDAMEPLLGVEVEWVKNAFANELPGLQAGRFDLVMDQMGDTAERQQLVDFVDYAQEKNAIVVSAGNPHNIDGMSSLCGRSVALIPGQSAVPIVEAEQPQCAASGKPEIRIVTVPSAADKYLAVSSGRTDSAMGGFSDMTYTIENQNEGQGLELVPNPFGRAQVGIASNKENSQLTEAIRSALEKIIANGEYATIMAKYRLSDLSVEDAQINNDEVNTF